jgi:hypothetical protein
MHYYRTWNAPFAFIRLVTPHIPSSHVLGDESASTGHRWRDQGPLRRSYDG